MKKTINLAVIALACLMLILGIVAAHNALSMANPKNVAAGAGRLCVWAKDGRKIVLEEVDEEDKTLFVQSEKIEYISTYQLAKRYEKSKKLRLEEMRKNDDGSDESRKEIRYQELDVQLTENARKTFGKSLFSTTMGAFFDPYFLVIVLCGTVLIINNGTKRRKNEKNS